MNEAAGIPASAWMAAALLAPALCALAASGVRHRANGLLVAWSAAPAVGSALLLPEGSSAAFSWVLLESRLSVDSTGRIFLLFTGVLWLLAGLYGADYLRRDPRIRRFYFFWGLAACGNFGLILAQDMITFFACFTLMSFASYGLVVHTADAEAFRAGRIYIVLVVVGEVLVYSGMVAAAQAAGTYELSAAPAAPLPPIARLLLTAGFGIKAGALPLHVWLPLAHSAAPTPASAVLSGAMINAGLLGWLRWLAPPVAGTDAWGALLLAAGLAAAFYGVLVGLTQSKPKTILAYSSISQMGLITAALGIALYGPAATAAALHAVPLYAMHHGFAKGALFLGVGLLPIGSGRRARRTAAAGLACAALSLAGAPFTSGALAKAWMKVAAGALPQPAAALLGFILPLAAVGTTLLLGRFLWVLYREPASGSAPSQAMWATWGLLLLPSILIPFTHWGADPVAEMGASGWVTAVWPVAVGTAVLTAAAAALRRGTALRMPALPPGDIVAFYSSVLLRVARAMSFNPIPPGEGRMMLIRRTGLKAVSAARQVDARMGDWRMLGLLFLFLICLLYFTGSVS